MGLQLEFSLKSEAVLCGKIDVTVTILTIWNVDFGGMRCIYSVVHPSARLQLPKLKLCAHWPNQRLLVLGNFLPKVSLSQGRISDER